MCQMKIIDEITNRLAHDLRELGDNVDKVIPVNHFDVIGGVDFGAYVKNDPYRSHLILLSELLQHY